MFGVGRLGGAVGVEFGAVLGEVGGCGAGEGGSVGIVGVGVGDGVEGWELWSGGGGGGGGGGFWWGGLIAASLGGRGGGGGGGACGFALRGRGLAPVICC